MPIGVFQAVREVSSEDSVHMAANLLKEHAGKWKWKTQQTGEKSAYVILEFSEPQQITGIDIGNEHSAFIEVMVSRSGCQPDDFNAILLSSSFMTPIESKNSSNSNRVRCFNGEALCSTALPEKWKLVKIICTQPFNKHVQYGLSFIKVHVSQTMASSSVAPSTVSKPKSLVPDKFKQFGIFKMREESPDSESESQVALFQRWKLTRGETSTTPATTPAAAPASAAAAIRDASSASGLRRLSQGRPSPLTVASKHHSPSPAINRTESKALDRNRESLLFGDDKDDDGDIVSPGEDAKLQRLSKHIEADKNRRRVEHEKEMDNKKRNKSKRLSIDKSINGNDTKVESDSKSKHKDSPSRPPKRLSSSLTDESASTPAKKPKKDEPELQYRPFNQLLRGVVLVISGIQNPDRGDLRSKAMALGAKYKTDWEPGCTHLICAFKNTPKYNQVRGKGKIVTRSWIEKCYALKKYLPWRRYALDTNDLGQPESDVELLDESMKPETKVDQEIDERMDEEFESHGKIDLSDNTHNVSSGIDTEDELERVAEENKRKNTKEEKYKSRDVYEISTDEEDYLEEKRKQGPHDGIDI